jgi:propanol-preferring alcohol dehydrogenase
LPAMVLKTTAAIAENKTSLEYMERSGPEPRAGEVLIKVSACGVCHAEPDEIEGRTPPPVPPAIPGHQRWAGWSIWGGYRPFPEK